MEKKKRFSEEEMKKAMSVSIIDYINANNIGNLEKESNKYYRFKFKEHDSIVIDTRKNYFIHNAMQGEKNATGNIINFIQYIYDNKVDFKQAVLECLKFAENGYKPTEIEFEKKEFKYDFTLDSKNWKSVSYLTNNRKIDRNLVDKLFKQGYLSQDKYFNLITNWTIDGRPPLHNHSIVGATQILTKNRNEIGNAPNKYIKEASEENFGFNITIGDTIKDIYFFEATVDMLSYMTMYPESIQNARFVSLEGVKHNSMAKFVANTYAMNIAKGFEDGFNVHLCVDNDTAGHQLLDRYMEYNNDQIKFFYDLPQYNALTKKEFNEITNAIKDKTIPFELVTSFYLFERPRIEKEDLETQFFYDGIEKGVKLLADAYQNNENNPEKTIEQSIYNNREKSRIKSWFTSINTKETKLEIVDTLFKDWNDILVAKSTDYQSKVIEKREYVEVEQKQSIEPTISDYVLTNSKKLNEVEKNNYHKKTKIDKDIIDVFVNKGWIRQSVATDEIFYVWGRQGKIVGAELNNEKIIEKSTKDNSFIFTIGKPHDIYLFDKPLEAISFLNLNKDIKNAVFIVDNPLNKNYLLNKIKEYDKLYRLNSINDCLINKDKKRQFNESLSKEFNVVNQIAKLEVNQTIIHEYEPINKNWNTDLSILQEIKNLNAIKEKLQSKTIIKQYEPSIVR